MQSTHTILYLLILAFAGSCSSGQSDKKPGGGKPSGPVVIDVSVATLQGFSDPVEAGGTVLSEDMVELRPEMNGRIVYLNIPEGKTVAEGTLLVKLFDDDLRAQLRKTESQLDIARKTESRMKQLLDVSGLNRQEYDQALSQVQVLENEADFIRAQLRKTEIRAPFSGTIGLRKVSQGAYVGPSDIIATIQQSSRLKVDFVLPERYAHILKTGDEVTVSMNEGTSAAARIIAIEPAVNEVTRNIQLRAMLDERSGFRAGSFVRVITDVARGRKAILVPTNSIIPETRFKKVVLIKSGKAEQVNVETGYRGEGLVEIVSGLTEGDTFAVSGILYLKPGAEVKIRSVRPMQTYKDTAK